MAALVCAYQAARTRKERVSALEGDYKAKQLAKPLPASDHQAMRLAFEKRWWRLEDAEVPARSYLERKLDKLEKGDMRPGPLSAVFSADEEEPEVLTPVWTRNRSLTLRAGGGTRVEAPAGPEALRRRLTLLGTGLMMMAMRHSNRPEIQGLVPQQFQSYLAYLLGDFCWNLVARSQAGEAVAHPAWGRVLSYEMAIRKKAWQLVQRDSLPFGEALKAAYSDPLTKERHFTTPLALTTVARRTRDVDETEKGTKKVRTHGKGKEPKAGGDKGKGRGKHDNTPDGKPICFRFNDKKRTCNNKRCKFVHACSLCLGGHPAYERKGAAKGADAMVDGSRP